MLIYPILLVISNVDVEMVSTRNKKQQNKKLPRQFSEKDNDVMIGQSNQGEQTESRDNMLCRGTSSDNAINPAQIK